jgi:hypothetical protein
MRLISVCLAAGIASPLLASAVRSPSVAQSTQQREMESTVPKNVPIKLKLKAEKEAKFKDRSNPEWLGDFELEVTNTSNKPIFHLALELVLPDTRSDNNNPIGFTLRYGRIDFIDFNTRPIASDVPIQPGDTHAFTIDEDLQRGWQEYKASRNVLDPAKVQIWFVRLSFGDGSGFDVGGEPYPYKRSELATRGAAARPR